MRIAVVNWSRRRAGGVETYLGGVIPELLAAGHEVAFWHEVDAPANRERIALPAEVVSWSVEELGAAGALEALRRWQPDLIYAHGMLNPALEALTLRVAPSVFFAHSYYGTCISGAKTFSRPVVTPCQRRFGWQCFLHYYPNRCGGLSPLTMLKEYRRQASRLELLHDYSAIVTHSSYIQSELIKHGLAASSAYKFPYYVHGSHVMLAEDAEDAPSEAETSVADGSPARRDGRARELLFVGRMDVLKGGGVLLDALPLVAVELKQPMRLRMVGDGPARRTWEQRAARVQNEHAASLRVEFTGWVDGSQVETFLRECDLLVLPSLWPEPFGLVGPEAGLRGVPVAAFGVGGIPDWLADGVNGRIAPGDPPTAAGLAGAITDCLRDPARHTAMKRAAYRMAQNYNMRNHLDALLDVFDRVLRQARSTVQPSKVKHG